MKAARSCTQAGYHPDINALLMTQGEVLRCSLYDVQPAIDFYHHSLACVPCCMYEQLCLVALLAEDHPRQATSWTVSCRTSVVIRVASSAGHNCRSFESCPPGVSRGQLEVPAPPYVRRGAWDASRTLHRRSGPPAMHASWRRLLRGRRSCAVEARAGCASEVDSSTSHPPSNFLWFRVP